jgi:hypothetical protein
LPAAKIHKTKCLFVAAAQRPARVGAFDLLQKFRIDALSA